MPRTQPHRVTQRVEDGVRDVRGIVSRGHALQQDHELVAAEARERVTGPDGATETVPDDPQDLVADLMAEGVVDDLEAVDVAEEKRHPTPGAVGLQQRVIEVVEEQAPVGQPREGVLKGMPGQLLLEGLPVGGVPEDDHGARRRASDNG